MVNISLNHKFGRNGCIISFLNLPYYRYLYRRDYKMKNYLKKKSKLVTVYFTEQNLKPQNQTLQTFVSKWEIMHDLHFYKIYKN